MERIKLTDTEKKIMRLLNAGFYDVPSDIPYDQYAVAAKSLQNKGFVKCTFLTSGKVWNIYLTKDGKFYLYNNPGLLNPIPWKAISAIVAILAFIVSIIALFVSCAAMRMR